MDPTPPAQLPLIAALVAGPVNRISFFDEQRRRRRQTWRHTASCALAIALGGMPLALFMTPVAYLALVLILRTVPRYTSLTVPPPLWAGLRELAGVIPAYIGTWSDMPDVGPVGVVRYLAHAATTLAYPFGSAALTAAALLLPGMLLILLVWVGYRALFRYAGVGGMLLHLGARPPRPDDLEERQLANLVQEMALAAGLPAPEVRLLDSPIPNAAAIGSTPHDAVVIVTRGLLDALDRDETQGVIANLIGSVGNGDLHIALSITTVFQALELIFAGFDAALNLSGSAWRDLFRVMVCALSGGRDVRAAESIARLMTRPLGEVREDGVIGVLHDAEQEHPRSWLGRLFRWLPMLRIVFFPFLLGYVLLMLLRIPIGMGRELVVAPMLMRIWRTRRLLADATAVQLTRNPDGLANGLARLAQSGGVVPGGQWFSHLFVVGPEAAAARNSAALQRRLAGQIVGEFAAAQAQSGGNELTGELGGAPSHPSIWERIHQLVPLGAQPTAPSARADAAPEPGGARLRHTETTVLRVLVAVPFLAVVGTLGGFALSAIFMFGVFAAILFAGAAMMFLLPLLG